MASPPSTVELARAHWPPWHRQARRRSRWLSVSGRSTTRVCKSERHGNVLLFLRVLATFHYALLCSLPICTLLLSHHTFSHPAYMYPPAFHLKIQHNTTQLNPMRTKCDRKEARDAPRRYGLDGRQDRDRHQGQGSPAGPAAVLLRQCLYVLLDAGGGV